MYLASAQSVRWLAYREHGAEDSLVGSAFMQMVERPWGITAFGAASVKALPNLVRVRFKIVRLEQTPAAAFEAARTAVRAVRGALREHGIADAAVEGSRLDLKTATEYADGSRRFIGYQCQAAFAVQSGVLDDVEPLLIDIVSAGANEIEGVDFDVTGKRELRAEARRQAVAAARAKAELYAEAASVRIGAVLHIEDIDPEQPGAARYRGHAEAAATSAQDLAPGHVVVSAAVVLGYAVAGA
ncbi:SIMPL domain-containing protein [Micromonospora sp. NRRL B-16802]|uniref:SIMPL domain-containing protein n=1 Tax=Micromonospora sp. NRRL B-16802 TaxID=1415541 RepID=UPI000A78E3A0|nr:SIMPL domain-containing protein [Micromonospora sp. NRRL B-16802]